MTDGKLIKSGIAFLDYTWQPGIPGSAGESVQATMERPLKTPRAGFVGVRFGADLFAPEVTDDVIAEVLATAVLSAAVGIRHQFLLLTSHVELMHASLSALRPEDVVAAAHHRFGEENAIHVENGLNGVLGTGRNAGWPVQNVLLGTAIRTDDDVVTKVPHLIRLASGGWRTWLLVDPSECIHLEVACTSCLTCNGVQQDGECCESFAEMGEHFRGIGFVVVGSQKCDPAWVQTLCTHCCQSEVPFFYARGPGDSIGVGTHYSHCGAQFMAKVGTKRVQVPVLDNQVWTERPGVTLG